MINTNTLLCVPENPANMLLYSLYWNLIIFAQIVSDEIFYLERYVLIIFSTLVKLPGMISFLYKKFIIVNFEVDTLLSKRKTGKAKIRRSIVIRVITK